MIELVQSGRSPESLAKEFGIGCDRPIATPDGGVMV
jgi:hypothetical protein